jgi:hypothetical protein
MLTNNAMTQTALEDKIAELTAWWEGRPIEPFERVVVKTADLLET